MNFQAGSADIIVGQRVLWLCLQAGDREWHVSLPSVSAEERGKERVAVTGSAQSVTMERGGEGLSPGNQENLKRKTKLLNRKQPPRPASIIPSTEGLLVLRP